jgi:glycosyltransferase involved in cell wall biosynthesis
MKIVYFYQYFSTPKGSWGTRVYEFSKNWVNKGHEVVVVTSIYSKSDLTAIKLVEDQYFEGIHVKVLNVLIDNKQSFLKRIWSFVQYSILSCWYALFMKADIVVASSGPITVGLPGLFAKIIRGRKLVFETRDLWPEGAIELGVISNPLIKKLAYWFEKVCYRNASHIICLSPGMMKNIQTRFGYTNLTSIPNAADLKLFGKKQSGILPDCFKNKKVAIYTGNIGMVNNSNLLLRAAIQLKVLDNSDIIIVLVGDGQQKEDLLKQKTDRQLDNFFILDLMPKTSLVNLIQHSMVSLVPLKGSPVLDTSSPNKLFESFAAGIPVIQTTHGWIKELLLENECGFTVDADDENALVNVLIKLSEDEAMVKKMGANGRTLAEREFDTGVLADRMLKVLEKVHASD